MVNINCGGGFGNSYNFISKKTSKQIQVMECVACTVDLITNKKEYFFIFF